MDTTKALAALRDFYEQVPGFETANYSTYTDYRRDYREALKDLHECRKLYRNIIESVSFPLLDVNDIMKAARAFSGRLSFNGASEKWDYCPGQYWPIEYRAASASVLRELAHIADDKFEKANA